MLRVCLVLEMRIIKIHIIKDIITQIKVVSTLSDMRLKDTSLEKDVKALSEGITKIKDSHCMILELPS